MGINTSYNAGAASYTNAPSPNTNVGDVLKKNSSQIKSGYTLADLAKAITSNKTPRANTTNKTTWANTGNAFTNGLANLGQILGIGRNVPDNPQMSVWLTGDFDKDQAAIATEAKNMGLTPEQRAAATDHYQQLYLGDSLQDYNNFAKSINYATTTPEPYDYNWTPQY